jgi:hypothetical protein
MTLTLTQILLISLPPTITGIVAIILGWINSKKITEVHLSLNSRLDAFLKLTGDAAFAKGVKSQVDFNVAVDTKAKLK